MSDQTFGLLVLFALSTGCAVVAHWLTRRYWLASVAAAAIVAILFEVFARAKWDRLFLYAWATGAVAGVSTALLVGLFFRWYRGRPTRQATPA